jgi:hypothetical protein
VPDFIRALNEATEVKMAWVSGCLKICSYIIFWKNFMCMWFVSSNLFLSGTWLIIKLFFQMVEFLQSKDDFVGTLLSHIGTSAIMDLLVRLITCIECPEIRLSVITVSTI